jgi:hypothetical protein
VTEITRDIPFLCATMKLGTSFSEKSSLWLRSSTVYTANSASRPVISTVAPDPLRELLGGDDTPSDLARKTIEYQLECYEKYISAPRKTFPRTPSLVDALATKIPEDGLDQIPDTILAHHIWGWHTIPYSVFRQGLTRIESGSDGPPEEATEN